MRCPRRITIDSFCFKEESSPSQLRSTKQFQFGEIQDLQSENQLLRAHLRDKEKALHAILKPPAQKPNNRNELEALVARDTQYLQKIRQHNANFKRQAESSVSLTTIPERPIDMRLELTKYQERIAEYHQEKLTLCERLEKQVETIRSLTQANDQFNRMFQLLGIEDFDQSHSLANIKSLEDKINDLIAENSQSLLELNEVKKENMKMRIGLDRINKALQLTNRELDRTDKQYRKVAKQLQEIEQKNQRNPQHRKENHNQHKYRLVSQILNFKHCEGVYQQPKSLQHLELLPQVQTRHTTDDSRPAEMFSGSLFSFGLQEPSLLLLAEHNQQREKYLTEIKQTIGKYLGLEESKLAQLLLDFCQNLFYYPNHSELMQFLSVHCQGLRYYENYEVNSLKTLVNLFQDRTKKFIEHESDSDKQSNYQQVNTSLTDDL